MTKFDKNLTDKEKVDYLAATTLEQQMEYLNEVRAEIERLKIQLADGYTSIIGVKGEFERCKSANIKELRQFKDDCQKEIALISAAFHSLSKSINSVGIDNLKKAVELFKQLSELSANGFTLELHDRKPYNPMLGAE